MGSEETGKKRRWLPTRRATEVLSALAFVAAVIALAGYGRWWPFNESLAAPGSYDDPSIWQLLLSDPTTLGFVRLGIIALALFVIASVPALVVAGRWLKGLGTGGISADDAADARLSLEAMQRQVVTLTADLERVRRERDRAKEIARRAFEGVDELVKSSEESLREIQKRTSSEEGRRPETS